MFSRATALQAREIAAPDCKEIPIFSVRKTRHGNFFCGGARSIVLSIFTLILKKVSINNFFGYARLAKKNKKKNKQGLHVPPVARSAKECGDLNIKSIPGAHEAAIADVTINLKETGTTAMLLFKQRLSKLALNAFRNPQETVQAGLSRRGLSSIQ